MFYVTKFLDQCSAAFCCLIMPIFNTNYMSINIAINTQLKQLIVRLMQLKKLIDPHL